MQTATLSESCRASVFERRQEVPVNPLPALFVKLEERAAREAHGDCGGRYARYFKRAPDPERPRPI